jgi:hypothetical protein
MPTLGLTPSAGSAEATCRAAAQNEFGAQPCAWAADDGAGNNLLRSDFTVANNVPILQIEFENPVGPGRDRVTQPSVAKQGCECQLDAADSGGHIREALAPAALGRSRLKIRINILALIALAVGLVHSESD